jgi:hypothetical protein
MRTLLAVRWRAFARDRDEIPAGDVVASGVGVLHALWEKIGASELARKDAEDLLRAGLGAGCVPRGQAQGAGGGVGEEPEVCLLWPTL